MPQTPRLAVVFNPNSKKNRRQPERIDKLRAIVEGVGTVVSTETPDAVAALVHGFLDDRVPYLVADGGDGAFHWLVNAVYDAVASRGRGERVPAILPTRSGTIDFIAHKTGVAGKAEKLLQALVDLVKRGDAPDIVALDSLRVTGEHGATGPNAGQPFARIGFASALAGVGNRYFEHYYAQDQRNAFGLVATVGRILASATINTPGLNMLPWSDDSLRYGKHVFEPMHLAVQIDGEALPFDRFRALNMGAIDINLGGVFRLFPHAREQGVMHVQAGNPSAFEVVKALPVMAVGGKKLPIGQFVERPARVVKVQCLGGVPLNPVIDGEIFENVVRAEIRRGPQVDIIRLVAR